jgi:hypothetical protein
MINYDLARRRGLSPETIVEIEKLQEYRELLGKLYLDGGISAAHYREAWTVNEFNLQALWQFPLDTNYHMFWRMAGCKCPKMDNEDAWGAGYQVYANDCSIHGGFV